MAKFIRDIGYGRPTFNAAVDDSPGILVQTGETLLLSFSILNNEAAVSYLQLFNAAALTDVTLGTTVPDYVIGTAASATNNGDFGPAGMGFPLGLCIFSTTASGGATGASQDAGLNIG